MDRNQTGNLLIGAGVLAGIATAAYYFMQGGAEASASGSSAGGAANRPTMLPEVTAIPSSTAAYAAWASNVPTYAAAAGTADSSAYARPGSFERGY